MDGRMRSGGYINLSLPSVKFVAEATSTPNRISVYDMMANNGGEVLCKNMHWTGFVRGLNGITRKFETPTDPTDDTFRILKVPYYEDGNVHETPTRLVDGMWISPGAEWRRKAAAS